MTIHVLAHLLDTPRLAPDHFAARQVHRTGVGLWKLAATPVLGALLGIVMLLAASWWMSAGVARAVTAAMGAIVR